jgi:spore protease
MNHIRTDLALESAQRIIEKNLSEEESGIRTDIKKYGTITVTRVEVLSEEASCEIGKPRGNYITIESPSMKESKPEEHRKIINLLAENIRGLCELNEDSVVLIAGLGNRFITPDSLGPKVISRILVTRHIKETLPENIKKIKSVCALAPGVLGVTGIETGEILKGTADRVKPSLIIAIDALAARKFSRINSTIQMTDTGVTPGSGVKNARLRLDREYMGVPVLAIGVPTVVDTATMINDCLDGILGSMKAQCEKGSEFYGMLEDIDSEEKYNMITELLKPYENDMFVTPKEVDEVIERLAVIISDAVNLALQKEMSLEEINLLVK